MMNKLTNLLRAALCISVSAFLSAGSTSAAEILALTPSKIVDEDLKGEALISGNWLVGVHAVGEIARVKPRLYSYVPEEWKGRTICTRVTDQDGRYNALYEYKIPDTWEGDPIEFAYPTKFGDHIKKTDAGNSGVALHLGDCSQVSEDFLPVYWNARPIENVSDSGRLELLLNVNAGRADSVFGEITIGTIATPLQCMPTANKSVAFNYQCRAELTVNNVSEANIVVRRLRLGREAPSRQASVVLTSYSLDQNQ